MGKASRLRRERKAARASGDPVSGTPRGIPDTIRRMITDPTTVPFPCTSCRSMNRRYLPEADPEAANALRAVGTSLGQSVRAVKCLDCGVVGVMQAEPTGFGAWAESEDTADTEIEDALIAVHEIKSEESFAWLFGAGEEYDARTPQGVPVTPAVAAWWGFRTVADDRFQFASGMQARDGFGAIYRIEVDKNGHLSVTSSGRSGPYPPFAWLDLTDPETRRLASASFGSGLPDPGQVQPWRMPSA